MPNKGGYEHIPAIIPRLEDNDEAGALFRRPVKDKPGQTPAFGPLRKNNCIASDRGNTSGLANWPTEVDFFDEKFPAHGLNPGERVGQKTRYTFVEMAVMAIYNPLSTF